MQVPRQLRTAGFIAGVVILVLMVAGPAIVALGWGRGMFIGDTAQFIVDMLNGLVKIVIALTILLAIWLAWRYWPAIRQLIKR